MNRMLFPEEFLIPLQQFLMWNYQFPFYSPYFPLSSYQWPQFVPYSPLPTFAAPSPDPPLMKEEPKPVQQIKTPEFQEKAGKKPQDTIASRISRKYHKPTVIRKKEKEDSFDKKRQKKDRNLPSNICRFFIAFIYNHSTLDTLFGKCSELQRQTIRKCIKEVKKHIKGNQTYIRPAIIDRMCQSTLLGQEESRMFRVLFRRFIVVEFRMQISMMGKLRKKEKLAYFKIANRFLRQFLSLR